MWGGGKFFIRIVESWKRNTPSKLILLPCSNRMFNLHKFVSKRDKYFVSNFLGKLIKMILELFRYWLAQLNLHIFFEFCRIKFKRFNSI